MRLILLTCFLAASALSAQTLNLSSTAAANVPGVDGPIEAIIEHDGMIYIGGDFTQVGGLPRAHLASFDAQTGVVSSWAPEPNVAVYALAAHAGRLYVGGGFTMIAGQSQESIASFDIATGAITSWRPQLTLPAGVQNLVFDNDVHALTIANDTLYMGGGFLEVNGVPRGATCSFDLTNLGVNDGLTPWDPNLRGPVSGGAPVFMVVGCEDIYVDPVGGYALLIGGMLEYGGDHQAAATPSGHVVRSAYFAVVSATGTGTPRWTATSEPVLAGCSTHPYIVANTTNGRGSHAYISGEFGGLTSGGAFHVRDHVMCVDMSVDAAVTPVTTPFAPNPDARAWAMAPDPQGRAVIAGGYFSSIGGSGQAYLAMLDPLTGALNTSWMPQLDSFVRAVCFGSQRLWVTGMFTAVNGSSAQGLAAFDYSYGAAHVPAISVQTVHGAIAHQGRLDLATGWNIGQLDMQIAVTDVDSNPVSVAARFGGDNAGLVAAEFERANQGTPYALAPSSGAFGALGDVVTVTLIATDSTGLVSEFTFVIEIVAHGALAPGLLPIEDTGGNPGGGGGCASTTSGPLGLAGLLFLFMAAVRLRRRAC